MMKRFVMVFLALVLAITLSLAGCSKDKETTGTENGKKQTGSEKNPAKGKANELTIGVGGDPKNWDPIDTFLLDWSTVATSVFEGLVKRDNDLKIGPGLAESWEYTDDKTLVFKLRKGVKFHNGEPFTAEAVKFTFDRLLGPEGKKGPQQANYAAIDHVEVVDESTVKMVLKSVDPVLITKLAGYGAVIIPPKYYKEKGDAYFNEHPVGTGPFKMTSYKKDSKIVLEKNKEYWQSGIPKLDTVTFRVIPESSTRLAELQTGAIDIMKKVEVSQADTVKSKGFLNLKKVDTPTVYSLRFNTQKAPVDDVKVRQAINYAIDKEAMIDEILNGYGKPISTFQSTLSFGNNEDLKPYPYDPEKAKKLLKEAGVANGTEVELYIPGEDATFKEIAQTIASFLEQVGLKAKIQTVEGSTLISELQPKGKAGHMVRQGWGGWTLDFDNTAYLLYHKGELWNPDFSDSKVEELLAAERSTVDQDERKKIFKQLTERLYELSPDVPLYQSIDLWAVNKRVEGFVPPHDDRIYLESVSAK
ncbi:ABC transporter substrate-binding protein [Peribacillus sp. SCS-37]|uniref:ABC transporter substrate-binding protein n=1 Tax=Paraperibacillus esterisolvens TaxID=3115296 RepID=UPI0039058A12